MISKISDRVESRSKGEFIIVMKSQVPRKTPVKHANLFHRVVTARYFPSSDLIEMKLKLNIFDNQKVNLFASKTFFIATELIADH